MLEAIEVRSKQEQINNAIRILLTQMSDRDPDSVAEIEGISIFKRLQDLPPQTSCVEYLFGKIGKTDFKKTRESLIIPPNKLLEPEPDSIVEYSLYGCGPSHMGLVLSNGLIRSKWGIPGHVYDHPVDLVPWQYGRTIEFYRPLCLINLK